MKREKIINFAFKFLTNIPICQLGDSWKIINRYVKSLNQTSNKKLLQKASQRHDKDVSTASILMVNPLDAKAFSKSFGNDIRPSEVERFKSENLEVISILKKLAARKPEIVDKIPFDDYKTNLDLELIDRRFIELYGIIVISKASEITRKYVEETIEPVTESLKELHDKVDFLFPKKKT